MLWNEKIDLIKKYYPAEEFSVPSPHANRKEILRKIETRFIGRPADYYCLNNFNASFCNWWENIQSSLELTIESNYQTLLESVIDPNESFWIACEFTHWIPIYKAKLNAIVYLMAIGQTWTGTFHIIQLKYAYLLSFRLEDAGTKMKTAGSKEVENKIKIAVR